jgi:hypothetical protein
MTRQSNFHTRALYGYQQRQRVLSRTTVNLPIPDVLRRAHGSRSRRTDGYKRFIYGR